MVLDEEPWRTQFYSKEKSAGGLVEAMASDLRLAQTFVGLGQMDPRTAETLASGLGLKTLSEKYSTLLFRYSSALALEKNRAAVPGRDAAETIWSNLVGVSPRQPGPFFGALLSKDAGKLLAFYSALTELDTRHQRFFTRTQAARPSVTNCSKAPLKRSVA